MQMHKNRCVASAIAVAAVLAVTPALAQMAAPAGNPNAESARAPGAVGAATSIKAKIQSVDLAGRTLTLDNGKTYTFAENFDTATLKTGQNVTVTIDVDRPNIVVKVVPAE